MKYRVLFVLCCAAAMLSAQQVIPSPSSSGGGGGGGVSGTVIFYTYMPSAKCNQGVPGPAFSLPSTNYPAVNCGAAIYTGGTARASGVLTFTATGQGVEDHVELPPDQTGAVDVEIVFNSTAITGNIVWNIATGCAANGALPDPAIGTADTLTAAAKGTTLWRNTATKTTVNLNSCAAGSELFWRIGLDATTTATVNASTYVNLIGVRFLIRRAL